MEGHGQCVSSDLNARGSGCVHPIQHNAFQIHGSPIEEENPVHSEEAKMRFMVVVRGEGSTSNNRTSLSSVK